VGRPERDHDPGKRVKIRKRQLLRIRRVSYSKKVHAANVFDRDGMKPLMELIGGQFPCLTYLWPDTGHNGKGKGRDWIEKTLRWTVEVV
jgi:hypothetical protein